MNSVHQTRRNINRSRRVQKTLRGIRPSMRSWCRPRHLHFDIGKVCRASQFKIFHVGRVIEKEVADSRCLVHTVASRYKGFLVFIHEASPTFQHVDDVELRLMDMPTGSPLGLHIRLHQLSNDTATGSIFNPEVSISKKITKAAGKVGCIRWPYMGKLDRKSVV